MVMWSAVSGLTAADVLGAVGETDKAFRGSWKNGASRSPTIAADADLVRQHRSPRDKTDAAEAAMKKAISINPEDPDAWTRLVTFYFRPNSRTTSNATLRRGVSGFG